MPGLYGIVNSSKPLTRSFERFWDHAKGSFANERMSDPREGWEIGRLHLGILHPEQQLEAAASVHVLFHGDFARSNELESPRADGGPLVPRDLAAAHVGELYRRFGLDFAAHVDGSFCCVLLDRDHHRVILLADRLGSCPLYWSVEGDALVFGSELRAVLSYRNGTRSLNPAAVGDYLTFGFLFGTKTLADGVDLVPPGSMVVYDWDARSVSAHQYSAISDAFQRWEGSKAEYVDNVRQAFVAAVERALSGIDSPALSLSGGLDSRAILSAVNGHSPSLSTYTVGVKGCADEAIADELARASGTRHCFIELDQRYLGDFLTNFRRMVSLTDGMYLSHGLTEILALDVLARKRISVLLRGHGGELAKTDLAWPLHTDRQIETLDAVPEFSSYLLKRLNYVRQNVDWKDLFTDRWLPLIREGGAPSLDRSLAGLSLEPAERCAYLYLQEQHRRFTIPSLELFRQAVEVRMPFVDWDFLKVLFRGDPRWRQDTSLHRDLIGANPALLRIRNSNTGASAGAGPLTERVMDRFNSVLRRLNVAGYRHYHNFQSWMSAQLLASVEPVLLGEAALGRGMLRKDGVRRLLDETRQGKADHSYLLQVLLIIEIFQQEIE